MKQLLILICLVSINFYGQTNIKSKTATFSLKEVALLNIEPNNTPVVLNLNSPNSSGEKVNAVNTNNSKWVNFTSALSNNSSSRNLSIKIEDGNVPSGLYLKLNISNYSGSGKGSLGTKINSITLNENSQTIISNIRGAYTGNGLNNGYQLTYSLEIYDYKLLNTDDSEALSISLTLTDF